MVKGKKPGRQPARGSVRIIGGRWRGRRILLPAGDGVRPSGDRIRETLFNWLAPVLPDARCLDLFAGTGALGIEALSRGAAEVLFVERDPLTARQLQSTLATLAAAESRIVTGDALKLLSTVPSRFDVVFLDPPFGAVDLGDLCTLLHGGWLASQARIYLETGRDQALPSLPPGWTVLREQTAGKVRFALLGAD